MLKNSGDDSVPVKRTGSSAFAKEELEHLNHPEQCDALFNAKALSILSADSPFFDTLWPVIFESADPKTKRTLELTNLYFRGMAKRARVRELSAKIKTNYLKELQSTGLNRPPPNPLKLDPRSDSPLWYEWGADKAGFESVANFEEFCRLADVQPAERVAWKAQDFSFTDWPAALPLPDYPPQHSFLSSTGDICFFCFNDPMVRDYAYVHYFGCTGEREKALKLEAWFEQNCRWEDISKGRRDYI